MSSELFLKPKLTGERFAGGVIPLEVLADLAVLSEMILEVAKWKYREQNPNRKRVPRGFAEGISLKLTSVEDGSAKAVICLCIAGSLLTHSALEYFSQAKQAIVGAVGAAEQNQKITTHLPEKLLGYFDRFGRNLLEGEAIELSDDTARSPVKLTREIRRKLVLASYAEEYTENTTVHGLVHEFDQRAKTFQITLLNGSILSRIPIESQQYYDTVMQATNGFRNGLRVRVSGIGRFDRTDRLQEIEEVEHVTILDPLDVRVRIDELKLLRDGWFDGQGIAPSPVGLDWLADSFDAQYSDEIPLPYLFPTLKGMVLAEWSSKPWAVSLEIDLAQKTGEWHAFHLGNDEESNRTLNLETTQDWEWLAEQIRHTSMESA